MFKRTAWATTTFVALFILAACANQKEPASKAIAGIESTLASIKEDAAKFMPEDYSSIESSLAGLKDSFAKGDHKAVVAAAPELSNRVASLKQATEAKKAEFEAAAMQARDKWASYNADVPKMVEAIQSRVDMLSKSKKLPRNVSQEAFDSAKSGLESMKANWEEAATAFAAGEPVDAAARAEAVKQKGTEVMQALNMTPPAPTT